MATAKLKINYKT